MASNTAKLPIEPIVTESKGRVAQLDLGVGNNQPARASDFNPVASWINARSGQNATSTSQTGTTSTVNDTVGKVTFSSQSIAADASATYTITDSFVSASSIILVQVSSATSGAVPVVSIVSPGAGSFTVLVMNETGATTYTDITLKFVVL